LSFHSAWTANGNARLNVAAARPIADVALAALARTLFIAVFTDSILFRTT